MPVNPGIKKGGGGVLGELGSALGLLGAGIATVATGGAAAPALAAAATGAGIGGTVGGLADKAIDPRTADAQNQGPAISRRASALNPGKELEKSIIALDSPDVPDELKQQAAPILANAYQKTRRTPGVIS